MSTPNDDWRKRIEDGHPFDPSAVFPTPEQPPTPLTEPAPTWFPEASGYGTLPGAYPPPGGYPPPTQQFGAVPGYGYPASDAPYGRDPITGEPLSDKSKTVAGLLQILLPFVSVCGVGRLYTGSTAIGLIQLLGMFLAILTSFLLIGIPFVIGIWIWTVVDGIIMLTGSTTRDGNGLRLRP